VANRTGQEKLINRRRGTYAAGNGTLSAGFGKDLIGFNLNEEIVIEDRSVTGTFCLRE
jgi:hypothetical protein